MNFIIVIIHCVLILVLAYLIFRKLPGNKILFCSAFVLKMICGIGVGWLYVEYYGHGDTIAFYHDATVLAQLAREDWYHYLVTLFTGRIWILPGDLILLDPRSQLFVRLISPLAIVTGDNYWIMASYCSLLLAWVWSVTKLLGRLRQ